MELVTVLLLALQPVQGPTLRIAPPAMEVHAVLLTATRQFESASVPIPVPKRTAGWVKGGIIGGVAGMVAMLGVTYAFDSIDHGDSPYFVIGLGGAFGGFVIGSLIGGN